MTDSRTTSAASQNQFQLLGQRRFLPFFVTQFLGAFNDNILKNALVILLSFHAAEWSNLDAGTIVNLCAGIFILPFFLFSATAGQIADRYEKSRLIRFVKLFEILIMGVAAAGFALHSLALLLGALFLMGTHSTLFGPVKYAILPQALAAEELIGGNALVEAGTFVAILVGTILGGVLIAVYGPPAAALTAFAVALCGYLASRAIPIAPAAAPDLRINWNPFTETWRNIAFSRSQRTVFLSILGISWFWFYGAIFLSQFPGYAKDSLGGNESVVTLMLALFSVGIGLGSLLCERLSGHKVEIGLVPFGAIGLTLFGVDLWLATPSAAAATHRDALQLLADPGHWRIFADLVLIGVFGGFYIVPLYALVQERSPVEHRSRIIAGNNILNAAFMVAAALIAIALLHAGLAVAELFLVTALLNAAVAVYIFRLVPEFLMRFIFWGLIHSIYRLDREGMENIPEEGACIVACNHVSFVDALVIAAACPRPIRFIMDHRIFATPILSFVFRTGRAIPIASAKEDPAMLERAYDAVAAALADGDVVGIFPEGRITGDGELGPFRNGIRNIVERTPVAVVPLALSGLWGSYFSRVEGSAMTRPFRRGFFSRIRLRAAAPVPAAEATPERLQATVAELRGDWK
jgi:1-acyl-sn-glycerol-3-phosphate acyltransferase